MLSSWTWRSGFPLIFGQGVSVCVHVGPALSTLPDSQGQPHWCKAPAALSLEHPLAGWWLGLAVIPSIT